MLPDKLSEPSGDCCDQVGSIPTGLPDSGMPNSGMPNSVLPDSGMLNSVLLNSVLLENWGLLASWGLASWGQFGVSTIQNVLPVVYDSQLPFTLEKMN